MARDLSHQSNAFSADSSVADWLLAREWSSKLLFIGNFGSPKIWKWKKKRKNVILYFRPKLVVSLLKNNGKIPKSGNPVSGAFFSLVGNPSIVLFRAQYLIWKSVLEMKKKNGFSRARPFGKLVWERGNRCDAARRCKINLIHSLDSVAGFYEDRTLRRIERERRWLSVDPPEVLFHLYSKFRESFTAARGLTVFAAEFPEALTAAVRNSGSSTHRHPSSIIFIAFLSLFFFLLFLDIHFVVYRSVADGRRCFGY